MWAVAGLTSEAGEVSGEVEKLARKGQPIDSRRAKLIDELSDVLWYAAAVANELDVPLSQVIEHNIAKINQRRYESAQETIPA